MWFVSLAVAGNGERVVPLVAAALGVPEPTDEPVADTLEHWLRDRELLLVLDNCEPIVGAVASFAERYLARCAGVRILATSREFLGVRGERALGTPPLNVADDLARAGESDAVELFMVRASAAAPGFDADAADVATVAQICRRLDGLPLAIELAAARLRALSLEQIADAPRRPVPAPASRRAHARSGGGVELRPPHRCRAGGVRAAGGVPRRLQPRGGGDGRVRCRRRRGRRPRSARRGSSRSRSSRR